MKDILQTFRYEPDGARSLEDALCAFIKEEIAFGRLKGGDRLPTMRDIAQATGLTFGKARLVVERLAREGYVHSPGPSSSRAARTSCAGACSSPCPTPTPPASSPRS